MAVETLRQKQSRFVVASARLILKADELGLKLSWGDAYRDPRTNGKAGVKMGYGHPKSAHKLRLAVDLNLFKDVDGDGDEDFLGATEHHRVLGEWWEAQGSDHRWGGRFSDGNHYSIEHEGMK